MSNKPLFSITVENHSSIPSSDRTASVPDRGVGVHSSFRAETHLWFPESTVRGMDFLCVLLRLLARAEKERKGRQEKKLWLVDCRSCGGGLPQPLFLGLVLRGGWERARRDFTTALRNEKWHGFPKRGASSASYGLVKAVILICTPFLCCLIMEQRCQGLIGRITWSPVTSRYGR